MQKIQNLIKDYKPFDFNNIDEKLLIEYSFLEQWLEDNYLLSFIESIKEEYSFFLFDSSPLLNAKVYFIPNTLLCSLEKALNALKINKDLENLNFYLYAIEKYSNIFFYSIRYNTETKFTNMSYTGVTNWNQRNQTPAWVDSWLENYEKANKYDFLIRLVAEYIGVKELMLLKDKNGGKK